MNIMNSLCLVILSIFWI